MTTCSPIAEMAVPTATVVFDKSVASVADAIVIPTGPPGQQGIPGNSGGAAAVVTEVLLIAVIDNEPFMTIPTPVTGLKMLFINGLKQSNSAYSVSGTTVTLPVDLNIIAGDIINFSYA